MSEQPVGAGSPNATSAGVPGGVPAGPPAAGGAQGPPAAGCGPFSPRPATSGLAVASLVLGILSVCSFGLTAIPGLILGILGLSRVRRSGGRLAGGGTALAGIVVSLVGLFLLLVCVLAVLMGVCFWQGSGAPSEVFRVRGAAEPARRRAAQATAGMRLVAHAVRQYAQEHGGCLPSADEYPDGLADYLGRPPRDAVRTSGGGRIVLNAAVAGLPLAAVEAPDRTVMLFEAEAGAPHVAGRDRLRATDGPMDGCAIGFVSGRVAWVAEEDLDDLIWVPSRTVIPL